MSPSNDQPNAWGAATGAYKKPQQQPATGAPPAAQPATPQQPTAGPPTGTAMSAAATQQQAATQPQSTMGPVMGTAMAGAQNMQQQLRPQAPPSRSYYGEQNRPPQMQGAQVPPHQQMRSGVRHGAPDVMPPDTSQPPSMSGSMGAPDAMPMDQGAPPSSFLGSEPMGGLPDSYLSGPPPTAGDAMPMQGDGMGSQHMRQRRNRVM